MAFCKELTFYYREEEPLFDRFSVDFPDKRITAILGPSGCGKSTLLHLLARLLEPISGAIVTELQDAPVSYLFQEPRLLPWSTVLENVLLVNRDSDCAQSCLDMVGLFRHLEKYPEELSGGMRQRLAMARAFACKSPILLMDEPFQALDIALRFSLVDAFRKLWVEDARTTIFVTHDIQEALLLGDRILVMMGHPAAVVGQFDNPIPDQGERKLGNEDLLRLESELYHLLVPGYS
jgi:NitT/TauT family transport system ATP-binding protein